MSDEQSKPVTETEEELDSKADTKVILVVFVTAVLMAVHYASGFSFDF